jgi:threonine synthase
VGNPSNMERLQALFPDVHDMRSAVRAFSVTDDAIRARIRAGFQEYGQVWCPHTATAAEAYARLPASQQQHARWVVVATAHPAKFREIVEPLIGGTIPVPETLAKLFARPTQFAEIDADLTALRAALRL